MDLEPSPKKRKLSSSNPPTFLSGWKIYFIELGIGTIQANILKQQISKKGGEIVASITKLEITNSIIIANCYENFLKHWSKNGFQKIRFPVVSISWLTQSLTQGELLNFEHFRLCSEFSTNNKTSPNLKHSSQETTQKKEKQIPLCKHKKPASLQKLETDSPSKRKLYYGCNQKYPQKKCSFFQWADSYLTLPSQEKLLFSTSNGWLDYSSSDEETNDSKSPSIFLDLLNKMPSKNKKNQPFQSDLSKDFIFSS